MEDVAPAMTDDDGGTNWTTALTREWADELSDTRQDIYSLDDGAPLDQP